MSNLDIFNNLKITYVSRFSMSIDQTLFTPSIDTADFDGGYFLSTYLAGTSGGVFIFTLQESDESSANFTDVPANKLIDPSGTGQIELAGPPVLPFSFPKLGSFSTKRFIRFKVVSGGTSGSNTMPIIATRSSEQKPALFEA